ncbi:hypothetical protein FFK22_024735 [Mycobacterium sp. KBS0706]|uniref:hypothetical protein n=1 Tax=Mycobacterium sp. KBS0706 TaxID=2578109 RepID=UPI00110F9F44|nr:hypothetical protein [Mycobacterium sp. KBS0706]TSD86028.1 hypothetical protein FFK22_024735 [Mycobacterium sp. KBS0706]
MSSNLAFDQVAAAQDQKEVTINDAFGQVDAALTEFLPLNLSAGNVTVTATQARRATLLRVTGNAVARDLTLPQMKREIAIQNQGTATLSIKRGTTTISLEAGAVAKVYLDGTANGLMTSSGVSDAKFIRLTDAPSSYVGQANKVVRVNAAENGVEFVAAGAGVTNFLDLSDTPNAYTSQAGKVVRVNPGATGLEFGDMPAAGGFRGALVDLTANLTGVTFPIGVPFDRARYDSSRFWLGPDLTFTADAATDQITAVAHGMATGEGPFYLTTTGALPTGLAANTKYWAILVGANVLKLATSKANALAGAAIDITTAGSGTNALSRGRYLAIPANVPRVRITAGVEFENNVTAAGSVIISIQKNSADFSSSVEPAYGSPLSGPRQGSTGFNNNNSSLVTGVIEVAEGDVFAIRANVNMSGQDQVLASARTFFAIEVIEAWASLPDAPADGTFYGRRNSAWTAVQPFDADLAAIAALVSAADQAPYATESGSWAMMTVTAAVRTVLDDTTTAAMLATLGALPTAGGTMTGDLLTNGSRLAIGGVYAHVAGITPSLQVNDPGSGATMGITRWDASAAQARVLLGKSRGGANGTHGILLVGDTVAEILFAGSNGSLFAPSASIQAVVQATPSGAGVPSRLVFQTGSTGGIGERLRIDEVGNVGMGGANTVISAARHFRLRSYTVATLPVGTATEMIYVSDGSGGRRFATHNGTNWCWADGTIVS